MKHFVGRLVREVARPIIAVMVALLIGVIFIWLADESVITAYSSLIIGPFQGYNLTSMFARAIPLLIIGLGVTVSFRGGLLNIGAEGQFYMGALGTTCAALYLPALPTVIHIPITILAGAIAGGLWAWLPGILKARYRVNELFITLMMNYVGTLFTTYLVTYPLRDPGPEGFVAQTVPIPKYLQLARFPGTRLHMGVFVALLAIPLAYYLLWKTILGYEIRITGRNPLFAEYGGVDQRATIVKTMIIAGMFAGVAGGIEILGVHKRFISNFSSGYGFDGVVVAILGGLHPLGVTFSAILMSVLKTGSMIMERNTRVPFQLVSVIQALIIFFVTARSFGIKALGVEQKGSGEDD